MEANENISNFIFRVKDLSDNLTNIGENVSNTDLVTIILNGLVQEYQFFFKVLQLERNPIHLMN